MKRRVFDFCKKLIASMALVVSMVLITIGFVFGVISGYFCKLAIKADGDMAEWFINWLFRLIERITGFDLGFVEDEII